MCVYFGCSYILKIMKQNPVVLVRRVLYYRFGKETASQRSMYPDDQNSLRYIVREYIPVLRRGLENLRSSNPTQSIGSVYPWFCVLQVIEHLRSSNTVHSFLLPNQHKKGCRNTILSSWVWFRELKQQETQ